MASAIYALRDATWGDLGFLFSVTHAVNRRPDYDRELEYLKFKKKFDPQEIQVIQYQGEDVGRLRLEERPKYIYVGGIQLLPAYQSKGIGSAIFADLIKESFFVRLPIVLEVHQKNDGAHRFYRRQGFVMVGVDDERCFFRLVRSPT